jgi:hypothetical protein
MPVLNRWFKERSGGTSSLNSTSANNSYTLSAIFMLGFNYGTPTVYSGYLAFIRPPLSCGAYIWSCRYDFTDFDTGAPQDSAGNTNAVTCFANGFRCTCSRLPSSRFLTILGEHRWTAIANMNRFHNAVGTADLTNVLVGTPQQVGMLCDALYKHLRLMSPQPLGGAPSDFWSLTTTPMPGPKPSPLLFLPELVCPHI